MWIVEPARRPREAPPEGTMNEQHDGCQSQAEAEPGGGTETRRGSRACTMGVAVTVGGALVAAAAGVAAAAAATVAVDGAAVAGMVEVDPL